METRKNDWAIVLAAGDGTRLSALTDSDGKPAPKQFWSLRAGRSLLGDALQRAFRVTTPRRTVVVVAEAHRALWEGRLEGLPAENVVVQPRNRGTAAGILLPLLEVLRRDPAARVLTLPSDHFVERERVLLGSLRAALECLGRDAQRLVLLGVTPSGAETGYGWIAPCGEGPGLARVAAFVEKPPADVARGLMRRGALWNSFLMAANGAALLARFEERWPALVADLRAAREAAGDGDVLAELYERLEPADFSRDLLQADASGLAVLRVPECGWTDLGTPERVAECVARHGSRAPSRPRGDADPRFSLASAVRRLGPAVLAPAGT